MTIPSIPSKCNTPQLPNIVDKSSANQTTERTEAQLTTVKSNIKYEISNIAQKMKSLFEYLNGVKETEKSNKMLQKMLLFLQSQLIRKDNIIKTLLETKTSILDTVSKSSVEEEDELSPTRNDITEKI